MVQKQRGLDAVRPATDDIVDAAILELSPGGLSTHWRIAILSAWVFTRCSSAYARPDEHGGWRVMGIGVDMAAQDTALDAWVEAVCALKKQHAT